mgnify:CR=1 FL=1
MGKLFLAADSPERVRAYAEMLAAFRRRYPDVELSLQVENTKAIESKLIGGEIDIVATAKPGVDPKRLIAEIRALPQTTYVLPCSVGPIDSWIPGVNFITSPHVPADTIYVFTDLDV